MLAGGGGAQIIYSAAVGRRPTPSAYAASPYYLLPSGYEPSEGELQRPGWSHGAGRVGRRWRGRSARGLLRALSSWPARARCGRVADEDLTDAFRAGHVLEAAPFGGQHEQRALVRAAEHAREAAAVQVDGLQHLTALADPCAALAGHIGVPDGAVGVEADTVGEAAGKAGPGRPSLP